MSYDINLTSLPIFVLAVFVMMFRLVNLCEILSLTRCYYASNLYYYFLRDSTLRSSIRKSASTYLVNSHQNWLKKYLVTLIYVFSLNYNSVIEAIWLLWENEATHSKSLKTILMLELKRQSYKVSWKKSERLFDCYAMIIFGFWFENFVFPFDFFWLKSCCYDYPLTSDVSSTTFAFLRCSIS